MPVAIRKFYSEEEFLSLERVSKDKHEFYRGEIFAMSGATYEHNQISSNLISDIHSFLKGKKCNILGGDMRVYVQLQSLYTYPDAVVICEDAIFLDNQFDTLMNPSILFEILSKSTEDYDKTTKFDFYKNISSLKQYVLIDSRRMHIQIFTKLMNNDWRSEEYVRAEENINLVSIQYQFSLSEIYDGVVFKN